jgi:Flp pilus assembly protein TadD
MQEALATQFGDFSGTARETLAGVQTSVESSRKILQSMEAASGKAIDEQKETLVKMADLLKVHSEQVVRAEVEDLNNEGIHLMNEGRYAEATAALEKAVQIDPSRPELWSNLGHVRAASGQLEEAEESFRKALSLDTALEPALSGLGVLLVRAGRPRETLEFLRKQLEGGTASAGVVVACSRALATSGRHADAVSLLQKAAAASPGNADLEAELSHYSEKR